MPRPTAQQLARQKLATTDLAKFMPPPKKATQEPPKPKFTRPKVQLTAEEKKEKQKAYSKAWYEAHKDYCRQRSKEWASEHRDQARQFSRNYYWKHKDERNAYTKAWREEHKEEYNARMREYRRKQRSKDERTESNQRSRNS